MSITFLTNEDKTIIDQNIAQLSEEIDEIRSENYETIIRSGALVCIDANDGNNITIQGNAEGEVALIHHGKNFMPMVTGSKSVNGLQITGNADGTASIVGIAVAGTYEFIIPNNALRYLPAGKYMITFGGFSNDVFITMNHKGSDGASAETVVFDTRLHPSPLTVEFVTGVYCNAFIYIRQGAAVDTTCWCQIEMFNEGMLTGTPLEAYHSETTNVELPVTISAFEGANVLYTTSAHVLTATMIRKKNAGTDTDEVNALIAEALKFDATLYGIPVLTLDGDCTGMTKDDYKPLDFTFLGMRGTLECKKQGSSSITTGTQIGAAFDTDVGGLFNFTLKFPEAFEAKEGWGAQKKYCFKANAIDHSHSRNVVSCKLWGEVVKSRENVPAELASLPNGGAIDGFPIVIVLNGKYYALGTFNIPKDGWMFGHPKAILCADTHCDATKFKALATLNGDFDLEYVENEDDTDWVLPSINTAIQSVIDSDGGDLDTVVGRYIDIPSAIDYYIHTVDESADDGTSKNYILVTFDGVKWYFSAYDRDTVYGLAWDGKSFNRNARGGIDFAVYANIHQMMYLIYNYKRQDLKARASALRATVKSEFNVDWVFTNFAATIPAELLAQNCRRWPLLRSTNASNIAQIINWYRIRRAYLDPIIDAM